MRPAEKGPRQATVDRSAVLRGRRRAAGVHARAHGLEPPDAVAGVTVSAEAVGPMEPRASQDKAKASGAVRFGLDAVDQGVAAPEHDVLHVAGCDDARLERGSDQPDASQGDLPGEFGIWDARARRKRPSGRCGCGCGRAGEALAIVALLAWPLHRPPSLPHPARSRQREHQGSPGQRHPVG